MLKNDPRQSGWVIPLLAILLLQSVAAFLNQTLPVLAPVLGAAQGWPATAVGYFAAISMFGSIIFLVFGLPLMHAAGPIRIVQAGLVLSVVAIAILFVPLVAAPLVASLLIGITYGTIMPSGSQVLQQHAPPRHRSLVFSIKQAGVPLGAAFAGLALPAAVILGGWPTALVFVGLLILASILLVEPARHRIDGKPQPGSWVTVSRSMRLSTIVDPLISLTERPRLLRLALVGACLAANQGSWNAFLVTFLVHETGLGLPVAGFLFSVMQVSAIAGRLLLGFAADRTGSALRIIQAAAFLSGLTSVVLVFSIGSLPVWATGALLVAAGVLITGWNGIHLAELAQRAPATRIAEVSSGGMILVSLGLMSGPFITASLLALTERFDFAFLSVAALPMLASLLLLGSGCRNSGQPTGAA